MEFNGKTFPPPKLEKEQIEKIVKTLQYLKQIGANVNDQRYSSLLKILQPTHVEKPKTRKYDDVGMNMTIRKVVETKESTIRSTIDNRIKLLEATIPDLPESSQIKAVIELKQLKLLNRQRNLRLNVSNEIHRAANNLSSQEMSRFYLKQKKYTASLDFIVTERYEKQKRDDEVQLSRRKHKEFLVAILNHSKLLSEFYSQRLQFQKKLNRQVIKSYSNREKKEQKLAKERLSALKRNDEAAYLLLLEQTKNERLLHLIQQTDAYLEQIGEKVEEQQAKTSTSSLLTSNDTVDDSKDDKSSISDYRKSYYTRIHKITEDVKEQPSILAGGKLKEYQMDGLTWLLSLYNNKLNGILADEMGLGKTIQTIALVCQLIEKKNQKGPFLIVVPLSTLSNWSLEFRKWAPSVYSQMVIYKGNPNLRKRLFQQKIQHGDFEVCLSTFDYVIKDKSLAKIKWEYIIVDEGHRMKNHNSKLSITLSKHYKSVYRLILTGTPLQNSLPELWALLNFLLPSIFNSVEHFDQWFNKPFANTGDKMEMNEEETLLVINRLHKILRPFLLRRMKSQVESQLPEKLEKVLKCEMSLWQKRMYESMTKGSFSMLRKEDGITSQKGLMNTLMQLRKICNHPYLFNQEGWFINENLYRASGKMELLDRILYKLKRTGHRVLIFSQMTSTLDIFEDYLAFRQYQFLRLDGSTKSEDRAELLRKFNEKDSPYFVFILSTRAGGLGLNLQTADTVIIFDSDWNPQMDLQAQDRAHRIGQKNKVLVLRLVTVNSVEEKILERANYKLDLDSKIIEAGMFNKNSNAEDRKQFLLSLLVKDDDEEDDDDDVPNSKQVNQMIARSDEEYALFQQMDKEMIQKEKEDWEKRGITTPHSRLVQFEELPAWLQVDFDIKNSEREENMLVEFGRGRRKRSDITYSENSDEEDLLNEDFSDPKRTNV